DNPADVARQGYEALMAGEERVVASSPMSKLQGRASRILPDSIKPHWHRVTAKPGSGDVIGTSQRLLARIAGGTTTASRSLPIRCMSDDVERRWSEGRDLIIGDLPVRSAHIARGAD